MRPVNNAGTEGKRGPVTEQTAESYAAVFDTNVLGVLLSMKHELRVMLAQRSGSIINISSTAGHNGVPDASIYSASKHAVEGLTKAAALEVAGSGVRVNCVAPGPVETGMLNRFTGTAERKAGLVGGGADEARRGTKRGCKRDSVSGLRKVPPSSQATCFRLTAGNRPRDVLNAVLTVVFAERSMPIRVAKGGISPA